MLARVSISIGQLYATEFDQIDRQMPGYYLVSDSIREHFGGSSYPTYLWHLGDADLGRHLARCGRRRYVPDCHRQLTGTNGANLVHYDSSGAIALEPWSPTANRF